MQPLGGSRLLEPGHFAFCDGSIEGFGSLTPAPAGYLLDSYARLWRSGRSLSRPSGFRVTEEGKLVEEDVLAEKAGPVRPAALSHSRRRP